MTHLDSLKIVIFDLVNWQRFLLELLILSNLDFTLQVFHFQWQGVDKFICTEIPNNFPFFVITEEICELLDSENLCFILQAKN
jgi:hypothetical protein